MSEVLFGKDVFSVRHLICKHIALGPHVDDAFGRVPRSVCSVFTYKKMSWYQSDSMAPPAKRLIRRFESYLGLHINSVNAQVMELVYVLVLEAKFCGFESHPGHQAEDRLHYPV
jgi:hypothetical protein